MKKKICILSIVFLLCDILSKFAIKTFIVLYDSILLIPNFFSLTYVINDGAAFSILKGKQFFLILLAILLLIVILYYIKKEKLNNYKVFYYSLLIGGILGNLIDRICFGGVIDFLDFTIFGYNAPIFNLADTFIVVSAFLILLEVFRKEKNEGINSRNK